MCGHGEGSDGRKGRDSCPWSCSHSQHDAPFPFSYPSYTKEASYRVVLQRKKVSLDEMSKKDSKSWGEWGERKARKPSKEVSLVQSVLYLVSTASVHRLGSALLDSIIDPQTCPELTRVQPVPTLQEMRSL